MSWTRLDDAFTNLPVFETVDSESRWHYLCLIQTCSRDGRYDGVMPLKRALRASDADDPDACLTTLELHSLIEVKSGMVRVVDIDNHIPPASIRDNAEQSKIRMRRKRKHDAGDHSTCLLEHCDKAPVTPTVTRNPRTGQDGHQQQVPTTESEPVTGNAAPSSSADLPSDKPCKHGVVNGDQPDPWLHGSEVCTECRRDSIERRQAS